VNRIVGRNADIAGVEDALRAGRLVTITGPGGVGKTRLAVELAGRRARKSSTVVLVDLSALDDEDQVARAFAEAVGRAQRRGSVLGGPAGAAGRGQL